MVDRIQHPESPIDAVLSRLSGVHQLKPNEWMAYDPTYDDGRKHNFRRGRDGGQSLHISEKSDKIVIHSFGRGKSATTEILDHIGLQVSDLFFQEVSPTVHIGQRQLVEAYDYVDRGGTIRYQVLRYIPKTFRQRRPGPSGNWVWNLNGVERLLYRLPQLIAEPDRWVSFCEGERDANRLAELGMLSTCVAGGVEAPLPQSLVDDLRSHAGVCVYPDNDEPGYRFAAKVATILFHAGVPVKVVRL
jgi:hypothetical protein